MGPPREHGGMAQARRVRPLEIGASMGPPREHGGMISKGPHHMANDDKLQWGRRVNTAEWGQGAARAIGYADPLQWGRRVNTAECSSTK